MMDLRANIINNCPKYKLSEYPIKERVAEWRKTMTKSYAMYKRLTSNSITKVDSKPKDGKNIYHTNIKEANARVSILLSKEVDLRTNKITRDNKGQYTLIKWSIHHKDIKILIVYSPNMRRKIHGTKFNDIREIHKHTTIIGEFNMSFFNSFFKLH